jgi:predicted dithiol-disulfide oxidoreductase (DUF899 family)
MTDVTTGSNPRWMSLKSIALHSPTDPPHELWPAGASDGYVAARRALDEAEVALRDQVNEVAAQRRALPPGPVLPDYGLIEGPRDLDAEGPARAAESGGSAAPVSLLDLFGAHETLVVYHLMFHPDDDQSCPMCALWIDGLHGVSHHLARRTAFAVVAKAPIGKLRQWARQRGWHGLRIVSSHDSTFNEDLRVETPSGGQWPAVSVFRREGDVVHHVVTQSAAFLDGSDNGIDLLSPVWHVEDLLPQGREEWLPDNDYPGAARG